MSHHYMLIGQTPVPCDLMTWVRSFLKIAGSNGW